MNKFVVYLTCLDLATYKLFCIIGSFAHSQLNCSADWARTTKTGFNSQLGHDEDLKNSTCGLSSVVLGIDM